MNKKETLFIIFALLAVFAIIFLIGYVNGESGDDLNNSTNKSNTSNEEIIKCIGNNAKLIVSPTCGYCARQKQDLESFYKDYNNYIDIVDISKNPEILNNYKISGVPTWIINNELYPGFRSIDYIREVAGC